MRPIQVPGGPAGSRPSVAGSASAARCCRLRPSSRRCPLSSAGSASTPITHSLVDLADRILAHPGGSLPDKFNGDGKALNRCYDLMKAPPVTHAAVLTPHGQRTFERLRAHDGVVLNVFDPTELDFTGKRSL